MIVDTLLAPQQRVVLARLLGCMLWPIAARTDRGMSHPPLFYARLNSFTATKPPKSACPI